MRINLPHQINNAVNNEKLPDISEFLKCWIRYEKNHAASGLLFFKKSQRGATKWGNLRQEVCKRSLIQIPFNELIHIPS